MTAIHMIVTRMTAIDMTVTNTIALHTIAIHTIAVVITEVFFGCLGDATRVIIHAMTNVTTTVTKHATRRATKSVFILAQNKNNKW